MTDHEISALLETADQQTVDWAEDRVVRRLGPLTRHTTPEQWDAYWQATADEVAWRQRADEAAGRRVQVIARMRESGMSYGNIAKATGLSRSRVQQLVERSKS